MRSMNARTQLDSWGQKREIILHEDEMARLTHKTIREQKVKGHN